MHLQNREVGVGLNSPRPGKSGQSSTEPIVNPSSVALQSDKPVGITPPRRRMSGFIELTPGGHVVPAGDTRSPERSDRVRPSTSKPKNVKKQVEAVDLEDSSDEWKKLKVIIICICDYLSSTIVFLFHF